MAQPDPSAYFTSRASVMGQVPGEVVVATFAVFNPKAVLRGVARGWTFTDAPTIEAARTAGSLAQLERILGPDPDGADRVAELLGRTVETLRTEGRPLFAGMLACTVPDSPLGAAWRQADRLREYRGDSHINAWTTAGVDAVEISLLTELYLGWPQRSYVGSRGWTGDDVDAGIARLETTGLIADGALTAAGRELREQIEAGTDAQCRPVIGAIGDDLDELLATLRPWGEAIRAAGGSMPVSLHDPV